MNDTPRTDKAIVVLEFESGPISKIEAVPTDFARQLERELNEAKKEVAAANRGAKTNAHVNQELAKRSVNFASERDEWKQCAEELKRALDLSIYPMRAVDIQIVNMAIAGLAKLKYQTK
jgi:hypothetical protein